MARRLGMVGDRGATVPILSGAPLTITWQPGRLSSTSMYAAATNNRYHVMTVVLQAGNGTLTMPA